MIDLLRIFRFGAGYRWINVVASDRLHVELKHMFRTTVCSKARDAVEQNGRLVDALSNACKVEIDNVERRKGPDHWQVSLRFHSGKQCIVGRTTDELEASTVAAKLGTVAGKRVEMDGALRRWRSV
ncbi:hypothetical protein [Hydrogenophaga sp. 5NK40-0174]|uniref:hypothetical protein n=1 Tax=Hydrogenophaga sp. 5NK40-0174 TaxID=3127649 RepID=UPI003106885A